MGNHRQPPSAPAPAPLILVMPGSFKIYKLFPYSTEMYYCCSFILMLEHSAFWKLCIEYNWNERAKQPKRKCVLCKSFGLYSLEEKCSIFLPHNEFIPVKIAIFFFILFGDVFSPFNLLVYLPHTSTHQNRSLYFGEGFALVSLAIRIIAQMPKHEQIYGFSYLFLCEKSYDINRSVFFWHLLLFGSVACAYSL